MRRRKRIEGLLDTVPPYFSQNVISPDRRSATLAFGIKLLPLERQYEVLKTMQRELDPPPGVTARLAGLPVLAAEANDRIASPWRRLAILLGGLLAVALVLLAALRSPRRALVPLVPIALATGWSALIIFLVRIPLNPLSIMLSALVIAIATEFSVLLSERFRSERAGGLGVADALAAHLPLDGRRRPGLRDDRDRRVRRARALRHPDAARLRGGHRHRPRGRPARRARGAARGARPGRARRPGPAARAPAPEGHQRAGAGHVTQPDDPPPTFGTRLPRALALGAAFLLLIVVALNTLKTPGTSSSGPAVGDPMPAFAAPLALSSLDGDVNVATKAGQGAAGARPACDLQGPGILTSCELVRGHPAAIAFLAPGRERCEDELDALARRRPRHPAGARRRRGAAR